MTMLMRAVRTVLSRQPTSLGSAESAAAVAERRGNDAPLTRRLGRTCHVAVTEIDGCSVTTLTPRRGATGAQVLYLHGGAYINVIQPAHWWIIAALVKRTGATITVPSYALAPEHTATDAYRLLEKVYAQVIDRAGADRVHVAGDSAGAGLALGLAMARRDAALSAPAGLHLFSPWLDATMSNPDAQTLAPRDIMLDVPGLVWCGKQWAGDLDVDDPRVSPIFDHLRDLPPTSIHQGEQDIFLPDVLKLADRARGTTWALDVHTYPDGFHVFIGATWTREARDVFDRVALAVRRA